MDTHNMKTMLRLCAVCLLMTIHLQPGLGSDSPQCSVEEQYDLALDDAIAPASILREYSDITNQADCYKQCCQLSSEGCNVAAYLNYEGATICMLLQCEPFDNCIWGPYSGGIAGVVTSNATLNLTSLTTGPTNSTTNSSAISTMENSTLPTSTPVSTTPTSLLSNMTATATTSITLVSSTPTQWSTGGSRTWTTPTGTGPFRGTDLRTTPTSTWRWGGDTWTTTPTGATRPSSWVSSWWISSTTPTSATTPSPTASTEKNKPDSAFAGGLPHEDHPPGPSGYYPRALSWAASPTFVVGLAVVVLLMLAVMFFIARKVIKSRERAEYKPLREDFDPELAYEDKPYHDLE